MALGDNNGTIYVTDGNDNVLITAPNTAEVIYSLRELPSDYEVFYHDTDYQISQTTDTTLGFDYKLSIQNANALPNVGTDNVTSQVVKKSFSDNIQSNNAGISSSTISSSILTRHGVISVKYINYSAGTDLTITELSRTNFYTNDILILKAGTSADTEAIKIEDYSTSGGNVALATPEYYLKGSANGRVSFDTKKFIILQCVSDTNGEGYDWVEISRDMNSYSLLPTETPSGDEKYYLSKDSSGNVAFEALNFGGLSYATGVLDFNDAQAGKEIVAATLPPCIVIGGQIMVKNTQDITGTLGGLLKIGNTTILNAGDATLSLLNTNKSYGRLLREAPVEVPSGGRISFEPTSATSATGVTEITVLYIPL